MKRRRLTLVAAVATPTETDRVLTGLALPFGEPGRTSAGLVRAKAGAVRWAADLRKLKIFDGHDRTRPIGYVTSLEETPEGLRASFRLADTPDGNSALQAALEGVKDAVSVELEDVTIDDDDTIVSAELVGIALLAMPAFSSARLAAEDTPDPDPDADDEDTDDDNPQEDDVPAPSEAPEVQAARAPAELAASRGHRRVKTLTLEQASAQVAAKFRDSDRSAASLNAALADITPVTTNWAAVQPYQWVDELWTPTYQQLDWANAVSSGVLTAMKIVGWKRLPPDPEILPYAGNKAAIPTDGKLQFGPEEVTAVRHAVGADFDRIFLDFGNESVITTWLRLVSESYARVLDDLIGTAVLGAATDAGTAADMISGVTLAARKLKRVGARVSWVAVASDLYEDFLAIKSADAPWWLASSSSVDIGGGEDANGSASINSLPRIFESPALDDGTIVAGDKRAVTQYTPRGNPFTVRAVDLPKGGLDVAVFGYSAELVNDPLGIAKVTVGPVVP